MILVCIKNSKIKTDVYINNQKLEQVEKIVYLDHKSHLMVRLLKIWNNVYISKNYL
jgi:hypothetical protein